MNDRGVMRTLACPRCFLERMPSGTRTPITCQKCGLVFTVEAGERAGDRVPPEAAPVEKPPEVDDTKPRRYPMFAGIAMILQVLTVYWLAPTEPNPLGYVTAVLGIACLVAAWWLYSKRE